MNRRALVLAPLLLLAAPAAAFADVDVEIRNGDKVTGTVGQGEIEVFRIAVPEDALLSVIVKGKKPRGGPAPVMTFQVLDPVDTDISAGFTQPKGSGLTMKKRDVPDSAEYRVLVSPDGDDGGEYLLKVKWKSQKKTSMPVDLAPGKDQVEFSADAGARVNFLVKAGRGSQAVPRLDEVTGKVVQFQFDTFAPPSSPTSGKHKHKGVVVPFAATYVICVTSAPPGGAATVVITVKPPKLKKRAIAISDKQIGVPGGGADEKALGKLIGEDGGGFEIDQLDSSGIAGASIDIPEGALPASTVIIIGTAPAIDFGPLGTEAAGPTVFFGPEGLRFDVDVTVEIPFNLAALGGNTSSIRVLARDKNGTVREIAFDTLDIDTVKGTVRFPALHFTAFRVFGVVPTVKGDLNGDDVGDLVVGTNTDGNAPGFVSVFFGRADFGANPPADGGEADAMFLAVGGNRRFGISFATGDVNGDGTEDLLIGDIQPAILGGRVYVFFGGPGFAGSADADLEADVILSGTNFFGRRIQVSNVIEGAAADVIVTEDFNSNGRVTIFEGGTAFDTPAAAITRITGDNMSEFVGDRIAAGDFTGDDRPDLLVTGPNTFQNLSVHGFFGGGAAIGIADRSVLNPDVALTAEAQNDGFGDAGVAIGDVTGDREGDVVVVAKNFNNDGTVYVFPGPFPFPSNFAANAPIQITGNINDQVGPGLVLGDVNGDQVLDIAVRGQASVMFYLGGAGLASKDASGFDGLLTEAGASPEFGVQMNFQDVNADGVPDFVVTDPFDDADGNNAGAAFIHFGGGGLPQSGGADVVIPGGGAGEEFGN